MSDFSLPATSTRDLPPVEHREVGTHVVVAEAQATVNGFLATAGDVVPDTVQQAVRRLVAEVGVSQAMLLLVASTSRYGGAATLRIFAAARVRVPPHVIDAFAAQSQLPQQVAAGLWRDTWLDATTGTRVTQGNHARLLFDGTSAFAERFRLMEQAQKSIWVRTFIITADETGRAFVQVLCAKARAGVAVSVVYDAWGSAPAAMNSDLFGQLRAAGVQVTAFHPLSKLDKINQRNHEKYLIVDGQAAIIGGMNIADEYALGGSDRRVTQRHNSKPWRDVDVLLEGPVVADVGNGQGQPVAGVSGEDGAKTAGGQHDDETAPSDGSVAARFVRSPAGGGPVNTVTELYMAAFESARERIVIENAYFLPVPQVQAALINAAMRGVKVRVLTNSAQTSDMKVVANASRYGYDPMVAAGIEIYEVRDATLHAKTAAVDGTYALVGSANLNTRSAKHDSESMAALHDPHAAAQLEARFEHGVANAHRVTKVDLDNESAEVNERQEADARLRHFL